MTALTQFNERVDPDGRFYGPLIERGADGSITVPGETPGTIPIPTIADLQGFSSKDPAQVAAMSRMLGRFGMSSPDMMVQQQAKYLAGFDILPTLPDGSPNPRYAAAMERLQSDQSGRVLLATARRTQQEYSAMKSIEGNTEQQMIRIAEGDDPCDFCAPLDGIIDTYANMAANGTLPGGSSCLGGDNCQCQVYPIG